MKHLVKLLLPLGLGIVAGVAHFLVLARVVARERFVVVTVDMAEGQSFQDSDLGSVPLSGNLGSLQTAAVPEKERSILPGRRTNRPLKAGDLVFFRDVVTPAPVLDLHPGEQALPLAPERVAYEPTHIQVGQDIWFIIAGPAAAAPGGGAPGGGRSERTVVGPFRVLAVGRRTRRSDPAADEPGAISKVQIDEGKVITVAVRRPTEGDPPPVDDLARLLTEHTRALIGTLGSSQASAGMSSGGTAAIVGLLIEPPVRPAPPTPQPGGDGTGPAEPAKAADAGQ
jgi:hypothetical protein